MIYSSHFSEQFQKKKSPEFKMVDAGISSQHSRL